MYYYTGAEIAYYDVDEPAASVGKKKTKTKAMNERNVLAARVRSWRVHDSSWLVESCEQEAQGRRSFVTMLGAKVWGEEEEDSLCCYKRDVIVAPSAIIVRCAMRIPDAFLPKKLRASQNQNISVRWTVNDRVNRARHERNLYRIWQWISYRNAIRVQRLLLTFVVDSSILRSKRFPRRSRILDFMYRMGLIDLVDRDDLQDFEDFVNLQDPQDL